MTQVLPQLNVPLLDLKTQHANLREELRTALDRVIDSQRFVLGPEVCALEEEIARNAGAAALS
ncbi:hypothetical protein BH18ACI2_BH18ACI2_22880 [soil metagenome]|jgi:dTDP-4-amino-4,6-dideoxygalactose transaminase